MTVKVTQPAINLREKISELETKKPLSYVPAFLVSSTNTYTTTTGAQALGTWFDNTITLNAGGHFKNGKFTAPVSGIYHFTVKASMSYSSGYAYIYIYRNAGGIDGVYAQWFQTNNTVSVSASVYANAGDEFEPYIQTNYSGGSMSQGMFSGHYVG
jgi:hypothetical protein